MNLEGDAVEKDLSHAPSGRSLNKKHLTEVK